MPKRQKALFRPRLLRAVHPWKQVHVNLIGPYTLKVKDGVKLDCTCLTMIDPTTSWFEIDELPHSGVHYKREDKGVKAALDKMSTFIPTKYQHA